ncbi:lectin-like protein [Marinomonas mediterranea]|jgi:Lectin C-type domain.|uniref:C-type lectin domain protein n=1 Tax=Marinomonas mediterranea (strain ATCC 700492 / JCM 21426 / NBRC 103028 / MMB-1) TaxID=717774 RepID=F2K202_MARM1|nr:lectin-like protein [Marinomonas mediterranea]ADZ89996.1 C-type lectin domain protein [Marinomonas mediterranea MMB-1]WCN16204.1 hypothetical protein GV053_03575 [Marinomonas mediterranea MMB-1]
MRKAYLLIALLTFSNLSVSGPTQWKSEVGGNNHFYEVLLVGGGITWQDAKETAEILGGHLATINSEYENDFVFSLINNTAYWQNHSVSLEGPWIGGKQTDGSSSKDEGWKWVNGEQFYTTEFTLPWSNGEPNDGGIASESDKENSLQYFALNSSLPSNHWNDAVGTRKMRAFVVEYGFNPSTDTSKGTVRANFPNLILCKASNNDIWTMELHGFSDATNNGSAMYIHQSVHSRRVNFAQNGNPLSVTGDSFPDCANKTISELYAQGSAIDLPIESDLVAGSVRRGFPDLILCRASNNDIWAMELHGFADATNNGSAIYIHQSVHSRQIHFDSAGNFKHTSGDSLPGCANKSLSELYSEGVAYDFKAGNNLVRHGFPRLLLCKASNNNIWAMELHGFADGTSNGDAIYIHQSVNTRQIRFDSAGNFRYTSGVSLPGCENQSLNQLYAAGIAR